MTLPGMAPTYVLLCPLISATSVIPPTLNLKYSLFKARAIDLAIEILYICYNNNNVLTSISSKTCCNSCASAPVKAAPKSLR
ncbi:hypothetical protein ALC62_07146 [Cyphomyrmex costatus]|uniref:Uncharacterized protein n=1 Tax=Cyphomyrmex costatus TaxID=456900 RepID=A0A151IHZ7_9HYME|nr:hypothetical protein ALC62_07146 [Cyphomyrmex costatus]